MTTELGLSELPETLKAGDIVMAYSDLRAPLGGCYEVYEILRKTGIDPSMGPSYEARYFAVSYSGESVRTIPDDTPFTLFPQAFIWAGSLVNCRTDSDIKHLKQTGAIWQHGYCNKCSIELSPAMDGDGFTLCRSHQ